MATRRRPATPAKTTKVNSDAVVEVLPSLFLGPRSATRAGIIQALQATHVVSIGSSPSCTLSDIKYEHIPLTDADEGIDISDIYTAAADVIAAARSSGGKILIHCSACVSLSPTVVAAYLMKTESMTLQDALGRLIRARSAINPYYGFFQQLRAMEKEYTDSYSLEAENLPSTKLARVALFPPGS